MACLVIEPSSLSLRGLPRAETPGFVRIHEKRRPLAPALEIATWQQAMIVPALLGALLLTLVVASFDPSEWEVTVVPGLEASLNFKHYSGYLNAGEGSKLHYWFMESQRSPSEDPLLLWMTGGPGCSSLVAAANELGPFRVDSRGVNVTLNPYSWNKVANVIFLESPVGVGYSYDTTAAYATDDAQTTEQNYLAVMDFFEKFPMYRNNDFYVTGESYGGVFVPLLTQHILNDPRVENLKGFTVGNGALDFQLLGNAIIFFGYYHGLIGESLWDELVAHCCGGNPSKESCDFAWYTQDPACVNAVDRAYNIILKSGLNVYNLYQPCSYEEQARPSLGVRHPKTTSLSASKRLMLKMMNRPNAEWKITNPNCRDEDFLRLYFNRRDVIRALHVEQTPQLWVPCKEDLNYTQQHMTMREVVQNLTSSGRLKALIYNGDVDMACPFLGDRWFVHSLGYQATSDYRMWYAGRKIGGFVQNFEKNVTFVTVKGAGHMVPLDKPEEALRVITNFLSDTPF